MNLASCSSTRFAFGPGSAVTSRGVFTSKVVGISSSSEEIMWLELIRNYGRKSRRANGRIREWPAGRKRIQLVYAEEFWPLGGRREMPGEMGDANLKIKTHLRFQRTLASLVSLMIILRSSSFLRMRSDVAKSRFFFAALRSASNRSISASLRP